MRSLPTLVTVRKNKLLIWLPIIFLAWWGYIIRTNDLKSQSLWLDEAVSVVHATSILEHGHPRLPNERISWDSAPYHYLNSLMLCVFRDVHIASRILSVLAGCTAIPLIFLLCRNISKSCIHGMVAASLMTFCFAEIAWSRQARFYTLLQLLLLSGFYCGFKVVDGKGKIYWVASFAIFVLAVLTHRSGYILLLFYALLAITHIKEFSRRFQHWGNEMMMMIVSFWLALFIVILVPNHSNLIDATKLLFSTSAMDYSANYILYFWQELGLLLPLAAIGIILGSIKWPKKVLPLSIATIAYFGVICKSWNYFAFRYGFPLIAPAICFATLLCAKSLFERLEDRPLRICLTVVSYTLLATSVYTAHLAFIPQSRYMLGYTAPQPEWRDAYQLISRREKMIQQTNNIPCDLVTVSALPLFHDIYLGKNTGKKYYLPISHTGYPGDVAATAPYAEASLISTLPELLSIKGYLILDDFGLRMLENKAIQNHLTDLTPNFVIKHEYNIFIWILDADHLEKKREKT